MKGYVGSFLLLLAFSRPAIADFTGDWGGDLGGGCVLSFSIEQTSDKLRIGERHGKCAGGLDFKFAGRDFDVQNENVFLNGRVIGVSQSSGLIKIATVSSGPGDQGFSFVMYGREALNPEIQLNEFVSSERDGYIRIDAKVRRQ